MFQAPRKAILGAMIMLASPPMPATELDDPTPVPGSAIVPSAGSSTQPLQSRAAEISAYFADLPVEMRAMDHAWDEAIALYGDEGSDAWVAALEDGTHPLCRISAPKHAS
ncbi:MAG: hypothetical protein U0359_21430 [Byssovorax sp.]